MNWAAFLGAGWTRRRPTRPGRYPVATLEGTPLTPARSKLIGLDGKEQGVPPGEPGWQGYWWRLPYPEMRPVREDE